MYHTCVNKHRHYIVSHFVRTFANVKEISYAIIFYYQTDRSVIRQIIVR